MKRTRILAAVAGAFFWVAVGVLACYGANGLGRGSVAEPGAGFIFFWSGLVLIILSPIVLADSVRSAEDTVRQIPQINWPKIALVLFSLLLYAFFLERLGFVFTTFVLMSFLLGYIEGRGWFRSLGVASAAALTSYAMFELWLKIRLPKGFFGF
ncbi:MAG TPA: tripartite tricarboxylate transporter TctB family protein [Candidatus Polarisedimenticolaceae bacterium]|nr:tripartite tricarboxylate transporter TctB family protein [Candidatus Polarisedimenticolaceae bacterium]